MRTHDWHLCGQTSGSRALLCSSHVCGSLSILSVSMSLCFFVFCVFASLYLSFLVGLCFSSKSLWVSVSLLSSISLSLSVSIPLSVSLSLPLSLSLSVSQRPLSQSLYLSLFRPLRIQART